MKDIIELKGVGEKTKKSLAKLGIYYVEDLYMYFPRQYEKMLPPVNVKDIREDAFRKLEILPLKYMDTHAYGDVVSRVISDVDTFADGLLLGFTQLFTGVITILATLGIMLILDY